MIFFSFSVMMPEMKVLRMVNDGVTRIEALARGLAFIGEMDLPILILNKSMHWNKASIDAGSTLRLHQPETLLSMSL